MPAAPAPAPQPELRGFCAPPALSEILRNLYLEERTGILVISRSGVEKRVVLDRGMIVAATSSLEDERLPAFLVQRGLLRPDQAEALKGLEDRRAAEAILTRATLKPEELSGALRELTQQVLTAVFRWEELEYQFLEGVDVSWPVPTNVMVSFELIIRSLRSMAGFDELKQALLRQERSVRLSDQFYLPFDQLSLSPIEGFMLSRIDGHTRPRDVLAQLPPAEEEAAARFLFSLLILGLAQFHPPVGTGMLTCAILLRGDEEKRRREENERTEIRNFYRTCCAGDASTILGVQEGALADDIKHAYEQRKERYDAGRFLRRVQLEMREELQIIEARLLEAFLEVRGRALENRLTPEQLAARKLGLNDISQKRKELSKTANQSHEDQRRQMADQYLARARDYWKMGDMFNCIRYCEFAQSHHEADANIQSLLGQALARNPDHRWQRRAESALIRATTLEAFNAHHFFVLGEFYRAHNLFSKARKQYETVLKIQPKHPQARKHLQDLPENKS